jgi:hypothetical protein
MKVDWRIQVSTLFGFCAMSEEDDRSTDNCMRKVVITRVFMVSSQSAHQAERSYGCSGSEKRQVIKARLELTDLGSRHF